jgi:hypothetical protein
VSEKIKWLDVFKGIVLDVVSWLLWLVCVLLWMAFVLSWTLYNRLHGENYNIWGWLDVTGQYDRNRKDWDKR